MAFKDRKQVASDLKSIYNSPTLGEAEKFLKQQERVKEISTLIKKQNRHLTQLIDRILDISIWEKDQVRLKKKPVHIFQFIKETRFELKRVTWPSRKETIAGTAVVLIIVFIAAFFLGIVDMGLSELIKMVLSH